MDQQKDIFMITREEIRRYQVIRKVLEREINQQEASEVLRLSGRQVRRIVKKSSKNQRYPDELLRRRFFVFPPYPGRHFS